MKRIKRYEDITVLDRIDKIFKDKSKTRIFVGTYNSRKREVSAIHILGELGEMVLVSSPSSGPFEVYLEYFYDCLRILSRKKDRTARKWFLKEAYKLQYSGHSLKDYLFPGTLRIDWDKCD